MRGATITVRCDCGGIGYVPYGQSWTCRKCQRTWNTTQIPAEEYWGIMREMRRFRLTVMGMALAIIAPVAVLALVAGPRILMVLPFVLGFWFILYMPRWRRRVRERSRNLTKWKLRPELSRVT